MDHDGKDVQMLLTQLIVAENGSALNGAITIPKQTLSAGVYDRALAAALRLAAKPADEKLREALKPFARAFEALTEDDLATEGIDEMKISDLLYEPDYPTIGDLQKAHEAFSSTGES